MNDILVDSMARLEHDLIVAGHAGVPGLLDVVNRNRIGYKFIDAGLATLEDDCKVAKFTGTVDQLRTFVISELTKQHTIVLSLYFKRVLETGK